jgi:hypothetical protein
MVGAVNIHGPIAGRREYVACYLDGAFPAIAAPFRLMAPFQQMHEQDRQAAVEFSAFAVAHGFNFLDEVFDIQWKRGIEGDFQVILSVPTPGNPL